MAGLGEGQPMEIYTFPMYTFIFSGSLLRMRSFGRPPLGIGMSQYSAGVSVIDSGWCVV